jgi:formate dehydrogenase iron-sulfur subunit
MGLKRRHFLLSGLGTAAAASRLLGQDAPESKAAAPLHGHAGCQVDTTLCIGCRKCEEACNRRNELPRPEKPFSDRSAFRRERRPAAAAFTVVNEYPGAPSPDQGAFLQTYAKVQCLHCLTPSCVSACIVGAMTKASDGSVVYNPKICLGCRYCMVACPFQIPAYEYEEALKPRVRKCEFCASFADKTGADPACAASCPTEALVFGERAALLLLAKDRLKKRPDRYVDHVYGETEAGGTSWLYLTGRPGPEIGLLEMAGQAPAEATESIQHGIFRYGLIPLSVYGALGGLMWLNNRKKDDGKEGGHE